MNDYPLVTLTIINSNGEEWLGDCLSSIVATDYPNFEIIVIDNASNDGSIKFVKDNFSGIELICNRKNIGFGRAVNMAMNIAIERAAKYAAILNPDIKATPNWLTELVKVAEGDDNIGISMPQHYDYSGDELDPNFLKILDKNAQYSRDKNAGNLKEEYEVTSAIGGCMMIRTSIVKKIGFMDPTYFLYGEDSDFCRRAIFHRYKIMVATKSKIMHWHRILHNDRIGKKTGFLLFRNQFIYFLKDPNRPFLDNLWLYYFDKETGAWGMIKSWAPINNPRYVVLATYVQLWIFLHLSLIFIRHFRDRKGIW